MYALSGMQSQMQIKMRVYMTIQSKSRPLKINTSAQKSNPKTRYANKSSGLRLDERKITDYSDHGNDKEEEEEEDKEQE